MPVRTGNTEQSIDSDTLITQKKRLVCIGLQLRRYIIFPRGKGSPGFYSA
jgi:hypothetical protein